MNDSARVTDRRPVRHTTLTQGPEAYDQSWYPLALSSEVGPGQIAARDFFDGRVVVYRTDSGRAQVMSAYCRHLGASLEVGEVIGEDIRCAFHHWKYDRDGVCNEIPSGDPIPSGTCLFAFPTQERWGIIWAFNGEEPLFELPGAWIPDDQFVTRAMNLPEVPLQPSEMIVNSFDFQHMISLHGFRDSELPTDITYTDYGVTYTLYFTHPDFGEVEQFVENRGTTINCLHARFKNQMSGTKFFNAFSSRPLPNGHAAAYAAIAAPKLDDDKEDFAEVNALLDEAIPFFARLVEDDTPIMNTMKLRADTLVGSDRELARFIAYLKRFPKAHPSAEFIT